MSPHNWFSVSRRRHSPISEPWHSRLQLISLGCEPSLTPCLGCPGALVMPLLDSGDRSHEEISLYRRECVSPTDCELLS